ncbi:Abi family protein [Thiolapillus sp.]|uniref:Abi family protein n=1 Tax=Thiolapillus sp. TaxID=2017437 RepID=UPI00260144C4|nr:Abi family protein [Thiolapillus sp.]
MTTFDKPAKTLDDHLVLLKARGLRIPDEARARHYLPNISYYRFSAYTRPFYIPNEGDHRFLPGTTFDDILTLYIFDRELRLLLLDAIERIEVSLRAQMTNLLAERYGPHGYLDAAVFNDGFDHGRLLQTLDRECGGKEVETFVNHYRHKYTDAPGYPPIWMSMELLTFSTVSILFAQLRQKSDRKHIEAVYGWPFPVLRSWFRALSDLRNKCAHHMRIWNREFGVSPLLPRERHHPVDWPEIDHAIPVHSTRHPGQTIDAQKRLYMHLVVIGYLMRVVCPESQWKARLRELMDRYPAVSRTHMGFPADWQAGRQGYFGGKNGEG